jgi:hypothetical protein
MRFEVFKPLKYNMTIICCVTACTLVDRNVSGELDSSVFRTEELRVSKIEK